VGIANEHSEKLNGDAPVGYTEGQVVSTSAAFRMSFTCTTLDRSHTRRLGQNSGAQGPVCLGPVTQRALGKAESFRLWIEQALDRFKTSLPHHGMR